MTFFAKLILLALRGVDLRMFFVPICFGLGYCFIVVLAGLEKTRQRWLRRRAALLQLGKLDERELKDIGTNKGELERIANAHADAPDRCALGRDQRDTQDG